MAKHIYNLVKDEPDERDYKFSQYPLLPGPILKDTDYSSKFPFVLDQGKYGTCGPNAEVMVAGYQLGFDKLLSRTYSYYRTREHMGTLPDDSGVSIKTMLKMSNKYGIPLEDLWPYTEEFFNKLPTAEANANAAKHIVKEYWRANSLEDTQRALSNGFLVLIGMDVYESMETEEVAKTGIIPMPKPYEKLLGGHCVANCGHHINDDVCLVKKAFLKLTGNPYSKGFIKSLNSWGADWGMNGFFTMSAEYYDKYVDDAWVPIFEEVV